MCSARCYRRCCARSPRVLPGFVGSPCPTLPAFVHCPARVNVPFISLEAVKVPFARSGVVVCRPATVVPCTG